MKNCPACQHENVDEALKCAQCGHAFEASQNAPSEAEKSALEGPKSESLRRPFLEHEDPELYTLSEAPEEDGIDAPQPVKPREGAGRKYVASPTVARPKKDGYRKMPEKRRPLSPGAVVHILVWVLSWIVVLALVLFAVQKTYQWAHTLWIEHFYEVRNEESPPIVEAKTLKDGREGHEITFFGQDGELIFIEQMKRHFWIVGGQVTVPIPNSLWFEGQPEEVTELEVTLTPLRQSLNGRQAMLPPIVLTVAAPHSPIQLVKPAANREQVSRSMYTIEAIVLPGSKVLINGVDASDLVSNTGHLSKIVNVSNWGENVVSILVQSDKQRETRVDVVLERPYMDIATELDFNVADRSTTSDFRVSGATEPGAAIEIASPHKTKTVEMDPVTGQFSFTATLSRVGENHVDFTIKKEGKNDVRFYFPVEYAPSVDEYTRKGWTMDYEKLKLNFEEWEGIVFECNGTVVETIGLDPQIFIMDVGGGDLIMLENHSAIASADSGKKYRAWAHVDGMALYKDEFIPRLITKYMKAR